MDETHRFDPASDTPRPSVTVWSPPIARWQRTRLSAWWNPNAEMDVLLVEPVTDIPYDLPRTY